MFLEASETKLNLNKYFPIIPVELFCLEYGTQVAMELANLEYMPQQIVLRAQVASWQGVYLNLKRYYFLHVY
jgi:hypothetical protein